MGLISLRDERCWKVKEYCQGRLLDIGCGNNQLVKEYGHDSVGVDVYDDGGNALIVKDSSDLPFDNESFDTVSFVACLNHIPYRERVVKEANRLLRDNGRVIITMIPPFSGWIVHKLIAWWDYDQCMGGMEEGEEVGLTEEYIIALMKRGGFRLVKNEKFVFGFNNFYVFEKTRKVMK
ncbi:MAG: class I SAM-dependent methyltransferase [Candidatus Micrarchaeota archaeon]